ncbi:MAG: hypothetical protein SGBAC_002001 [Bacillariaceae sp.]
MKFLTVALLMLALRDSSGFQATYPIGSGMTTGSGSQIASLAPPPKSSLVVRHMLLNNEMNSNSSSSPHQSKHYFQNQKANGEVTKSSIDGSHYPTSHRSQDSSSTGLRMAHGAICPETIAIFEKDPNPAIRRFVETYHKRGPLACEDLLSDPDVLPHLTRAMRDIHP